MSLTGRTTLNMKEYRKFYYSTFPFSHSRDTLHCCCCCYPDVKWDMDSVSYHNSRTPCHVLGMSLKRRKMELLYNHVKSWNWGHIQYFPSPINIPHCYYSTPSTTQDEDITTSPTRTRANPSLPLSIYLGVKSSLLFLCQSIHSIIPLTTQEGCDIVITWPGREEGVSEGIEYDITTYTQ